MASLRRQKGVHAAPAKKQPKTTSKAKSAASMPHKRAGIAAGIIGAVLLACLVVFGAFVYVYPNIFPNVTVGDISVGSMSQAQAQEVVAAQSGALYEGAVLSLEIYQDSYEVPVETVLESIDAAQSAANAFAVGREGNPFQRMWQVAKALLSGGEARLAATVDEEGLSSALTEITDVALTEPSAATYEVQDITMTIYAGKPGVQFDSVLVEELLADKIRLMDFSAYVVDTELSDAPAIDIDQIAAEVIGSAVNATVSKEDGTTIIAETPGVDFDIEQAREIIGDGSQESYEIPITRTPATVTAADLAEKLFRDTLAQASTSLSESNVPRTNNVRLASAAINGTILNPGEEFSYNGVVGERSEARGYQPANAYANGQIVQEFGGGVCQPSSTLYMAVLRADLEVTERTNHSFTVAYTPLGEDATVDYGTLDFRFRNNTLYPIKIYAEQTNGQMIMTIVGTKTSDKTVTTRTDVLSTYSPSTIEKQDSSMNVGESRVDQTAITGYSTKTYKVITENGSTTEVLANSSNYSKRDKIVYVGTKQVQTATTPETETKTEEVPEVTTETSEGAEPTQEEVAS